MSVSAGSSDRPLIAVSGATGKQGGAVARHLLQAGFRVRGLTRRADSPAALTLRRLGAELAEADLNVPTTLDAAFAGVQGVFSVQNFYEKGVGFAGEVRQGRNLVEAARRAGVGHVVQSTMARAEGAETVDHFRSKFTIESIVDDLGLPRTFLGTVWFMDNLYDRSMGGEMSFPVIAGTLGRDRPFEMMAVDDLGGLAARVFSEPERFLGTRINIAGDRRSVREMREIYQQVVGRWPPSYAIPNFVTRFLNRDFAEQLKWQGRIGWDFSLAEARSVYPVMQDLPTFLARNLMQLKRSRAA